MESNQARWARMAADPDRARRMRERAAGQRIEAELRAAVPRILVLAPAPAAPVDAPQRPQLVNDAAAGRVDLMDEISWWGITAADFCAAVAKVPGDLEVHINSPGGDLMDSLAIYSTLRQRAGQVTVVVDGLAASGASVIMCAASPGRLFVAEHATVMVHDALTVTAGNEQDHYDVGGLLGRESDNIAGIYAARSGQPASAWRDLMRAETWFIGAEAVAAGLADQLLPDGAAPPEPGSWGAVAAQISTEAALKAAGPGRPGSPALRAQVYSHWAARSGRADGRVSPAVAAVFRVPAMAQ